MNKITKFIRNTVAPAVVVATMASCSWDKGVDPSVLVLDEL